MESAGNGLSPGDTVDDMNPALPLRALNNGNYGIFLIMGNAKDLYHQPFLIKPQSSALRGCVEFCFDAGSEAGRRLSGFTGFGLGLRSKSGGPAASALRAAKDSSQKSELHRDLSMSVCDGVCVCLSVCVCVCV